MSETAYVALLRAVNVGGTGLVAMTDLRKAFEGLGLRNVATHIQSGNVVFTTAKAEEAALARRLEEHLQRSLGLRTTVFLLNSRQLRRLASGNPFRPKSGEDHHSHIMPLAQRPDAAHIAALTAMQGDDFRCAVNGDVAYFSYPRSAAGHRRPINVERLLGVVGTARTWKVIDALIQKVEAASAAAPS